jgi:hypothetical protein
MPKAATKDDETTPASNSDIKSLTKRYIALVAEKKSTGEAIKDLLTEVKAKGLKPKDFKVAAKQIDEEIEPEHKDGVNYILEVNGQSRLFA